MRYKGCRQANNAKVVICALFTTPNSLILQKPRKAQSSCHIAKVVLGLTAAKSPQRLTRHLANLPRFPCMDFVKEAFSIGGRSAHLFSFVSFFVRSESPVSSSRPGTSLALARAETVKVGRRTNLATSSAVARPHLDSFEHDGTLGAIGMTIRGEPACGRDQSRHNLVSGGSKDPNHDAVMRIGSEAPKRRTHSSFRH